MRSTYLINSHLVIFIPQNNPGDRHHHYPHFTDGETGLREVKWKAQGHPTDQTGILFFKLWPYLFILLFGHVAWGTLVPWAGIKPAVSAVETQHLNPWTTKEVPELAF